ncbi:hypothetical protein N7468_001715 [Penicillium chermesinum]|uniref:Uncharacterized protein n=1 Tax=Penicillium chermesinum TaxID=63820 RepID=A0A9W9PK25_9EURO|nr:uncharacterized protein N7468_001715 [Penicillium chermesinum]KAJ5246732.1 hypothetical protein N7468_001715 [Penicillium chermesinum]KAJ6145000.1 hypothetical protein N7470_008895 [Penicillium chermesinum]
MSASNAGACAHSRIERHCHHGLHPRGQCEQNQYDSADYLGSRLPYSTGLSSNEGQIVGFPRRFSREEPDSSASSGYSTDSADYSTESPGHLDTPSESSTECGYTTCSSESPSESETDDEWPSSDEDGYARPQGQDWNTPAYTINAPADTITGHVMGQPGYSAGCEYGSSQDGLSSSVSTSHRTSALTSTEGSHYTLSYYCRLT